MTLEQISEGIVAHAAEWGMSYRDTLNEVPDNENVTAKINMLVARVLGELDHRQQLQPGDLAVAIGACAVATFRLGLLVGILLDEPIQAHPVAKGAAR